MGLEVEAQRDALPPTSLLAPCTYHLAPLALGFHLL